MPLLIGVTLHTGGTVKHNNNGVYYSEDSVTNICINDAYKFVQLRQEVYRCLGISLEQPRRIRTRCNCGTPPMILFYALDIFDETSWQFALSCLRNSCCNIMELWIDEIEGNNPRISDQTYRGPGSSRSHFQNYIPETQTDAHNVMDQTVETNETFASFRMEEEENVGQDVNLGCNSDGEEFEFEIGLDDLTPLQNVQNITIADNTPPIGNTYEIPDITMDDLSEDEYHEREEDEFNRVVVWPLQDRSDSHPVASFNSIEGIVEFSGDGNYFNEQGYATDDSLSVGQKF